MWQKDETHFQDVLEKSYDDLSKLNHSSWSEKLKALFILFPGISANKSTQFLLCTWSQMCCYPQEDI